MNTPDTEVCEICHGFGNNGADDAQCLNCGGSGKCDDTPDTEWEKIIEAIIDESDICTHKGIHSNGMCTGKIHLASGTYLELKKTLAIGIEKLCTSRDTYWKEQMEKAVLKGERNRIIEQIREERDTYWKEKEKEAYKKGYAECEAEYGVGEQYGLGMDY
jgi:hypothetical protein